MTEEQGLYFRWIGLLRLEPFETLTLQIEFAMLFYNEEVAAVKDPKDLGEVPPQFSGIVSFAKSILTGRQQLEAKLQQIELSRPPNKYWASKLRKVKEELRELTGATAR